MRERFHIFYQTVLLLIVAAVLLNACSSDSTEAQTNPAGKEPVDYVVHLVPFATSYMEKTFGHRAAPVGYSEYLPGRNTKMGIYMLKEGDTAPYEEKPIKYLSKWRASFEVANDKTYTVYGYLPKQGDMNSSLSDVSDEEATLTINGMSPVTTDDICIITGVSKTEAGLKEGSFSWIHYITDDNYYMYMLLNHLYASVRFSMKIDEVYAQLRTIKLKRMTLSTNKGSVSATISLKHNTTGEVPITNVVYTETGSSSEADIFSDDEGTALDKTTPKAIDACFAPTLSGSLTLVSTYDVYDSKGNLIRANCSATNQIPNLYASRGQRVQLNLIVNPTYLYVLSDPDLDNPAVVVN